MSDVFWKRLSIVAGLFVVAAIFWLAYFTAHLEIKDLDLWLHIGTGRHIVNHHFQVPDTDFLSCTIAGNPWNNHEWLFQVCVYYLDKYFGPDGVINMQVALVLLTLLVLFILGYNKEKQLISVFGLLLVLLIYEGRFTTRPDLFSLLFFSLYILILSFFLNSRWAIYALFVIQVLWVNTHGFFFFGPLFVMIGLLAEWLKRHTKLPWEWNKTGRLEDEEYRKLKWVLLLVVLACLINPQTVKGAWYPLKVFFQISGESKIFFDNIVELKRPIGWSNIFSFDEYPYYKLLILLSALSFFYNRRKLDIGTFIFWLVFLFFSLSAVRNLVFFAFAAYLVLVTNALTISWKDLLPLRIRDKKFTYLLSIICKMFLTVWTVQLGIDLSSNGYYDMDKLQRKSEFGGVSLKSFPYKAVDFLVENKVKGNFLNDFNSGAYMIGRCSPDIKVFIDGRTEVYGPQFFKYYKKLWGDAEGLQEAIDRYHLTGAFLHSARSAIPSAMLKFFQNSKDWVPVYFDYDAVIYLKDVPQNRELIKRYRLDLAKRQPTKIDLKKVGSKNIPIERNINRAFTLKTIDLDDAAIGELEEAKKINPSRFEIYKQLGSIYAKRKDYEKAFENFRLAVVFSSNSEELRENLGRSYYDLGEYGYAVEQFQRMTDMWPQHATAYFLLAKTRVKQKHYDDALKVLRQAFALDPAAVKDVLEIGDLIFADQNYEKAKAAYAIALAGKARQDQVHLKIGLALRRLGNLGGAKQEFEKGLTINPNLEELKSNLHAVQREKPASSRALPREKKKK